jgi:hypothetical protein
MSKEKRASLKSQLISAMAVGKSAAEWARANGVSERTAQHWAGQPRVRAEIELYRRSALDQVVGRFAERAGWAADEIAALAKTARSESVRLTALRSILCDMMSVTDFAVLDHRLTKLEEQFHAQSQGDERSDCAG